MDITKPNLKSIIFQKVIIPTSLQSVIALALGWLILYFLGYTPFGRFSVFTSWISPVFVILAVRRVKINIYSKKIYFGQGFSVAFFTAGIVAISSAAVMGIWFSINPEILSVTVNDLVSVFEKQKEFVVKDMSAEHYELILKNLKLTSAFNLVVDHLLKNFLWQMIVGLLAAAYFRT